MQYFSSVKNSLFPAQVQSQSNKELLALQNILCILNNIDIGTKRSFLQKCELESILEDDKIAFYQGKICKILNITMDDLSEMRNCILNNTHIVSNVNEDVKHKIQNVISQLSDDEQSAEFTILLTLLSQQANTTQNNDVESILLPDDLSFKYNKILAQSAKEGAQNYVKIVSEHTSEEPKTTLGKIANKVEYTMEQILENSNAIACVYTGAVATIAYKDYMSGERNADENDPIAWGTSIIACGLYAISSMSAAIKSLQIARDDKKDREMIIKTIDGLLENKDLPEQQRINLQLYKAVVSGSNIKSLMSNKKYAASILFRAVMNGTFEFVNAVKDPIGKLCMKVSATCFGPSAIFEAVGIGEVSHHNEKTKQNAHRTLSLLSYISQQDSSQNIKQSVLQYVAENNLDYHDMHNIITCINNHEENSEKMENTDIPLHEVRRNNTDIANIIICTLQNEMKNIGQQQTTSSFTQKLQHCASKSLPAIGAIGLLTTAWAPTLYQYTYDNTNHRNTTSNMTHWANDIDERMSGTTGLINSVTSTVAKIITTSIVMGVLNNYHTLSNTAKKHLSWTNVRHAVSVIPLSLGQINSMITKHMSPITDTIFTFITDKMAGDSAKDYNDLSEELMVKMIVDLQKQKPALSIKDATKEVTQMLTMAYQEYKPHDVRL